VRVSNAGIDIVSQEIQLIPDSTIAENIMLDKMITYGKSGIREQRNFAALPVLERGIEQVWTRHGLGSYDAERIRLQNTPAGTDQLNPTLHY
jgi:ABC-type uncharacterized transport system ATPase subunit